MATSGSTDFAVTRDVLIKDALVDVGAVEAEDTPSDGIMSHAARLLNMMMKAWTVDGLHLWKFRKFTLLLENGQSSYTLSSTGDHASLDMNSTLMRVAASSGATSLDVTTTTGMTAADYIMIELDDGTLHETTIDTVTDGDTVAIVDALADDAAIGNRVYWYTTKAIKPLDISDLQIVDVDGLSRPVRLISRQEYYNLSNRLSEGEVVNAYFDPQRTASKLYVYNVPSAVDKVLEAVGYYPIEDMDSAANDFDIPQEWYLAVKSNLAVLLGPSYGARPETMRMLKSIAVEEKDRVMGWDKEKTSLYFGVEN